jgi:FAD/FMN-containing dehydrogenase
LPASFRGPIIRPGDADYAGARLQLFNVEHDARPALIVRPLDADDVGLALRHAQRHGAAIAVRGGGHDLDGRAMADDALVIDFALMRGVQVNATDRTAHAEAGALLGDLDRATQAHGLATVAGTVSNTGIAGLTLGGGIGWLMRRYGTTVDNVLGFDVVSVEGEWLRVSEDSHPDLFWALRGGGGNFAVVTAIDYRLHQTGTAMTGGKLIYALEDAGDALALWYELMRDAPRELTSTAVLGVLPALPYVSGKYHGRPAVLFNICHCGTPEAAIRDLRPLLEEGHALASTVRPTSYLEIQSMSDAMGRLGFCAYELGGYLPDSCEPALLDRLRVRATTVPTPRSRPEACVVMLTRLGGAVDDFAEDSVAFSRAGAGWYWNAVVQWALPERAAAHRDWAHAVADDLAPWTLENCYVNLSVDRGPDWLRDAYGVAKFERLRDVKTAWDPGNVLRHNKNVAPRTAVVA